MPESVSVSIIGSGVVGSATGKGLVKLGYDVVFHDLNKEKLTQLRSEGYKVYAHAFDAIMSTSLTFVCVQTPTVDGKVDLSFLKSAIISIGEALNEKQDYHVVAVRSTLLPGTTRGTVLPILQKLVDSASFGLCYNPEFLRQASALDDFMNPNRIVIGELNTESGDRLEEIYSPFNAPIMRTDFDTAELIKHVSNAFLATKISFFNEIHTLCKKLGIDDRIVSKAVSSDPRIGEYGVFGGRPFLGGCLPKDVAAFAGFLETMNTNPDILSIVLEINKRMKET